MCEVVTNFSKILRSIKAVHKGQSSAMIRYVVRNDSELGYKLQTEFFDFHNTDKCLLSIHIITHRPDFASFSGTEDGVKWMHENVITKMIEMRKRERQNG